MNFANTFLDQILIQALKNLKAESPKTDYYLSIIVMGSFNSPEGGTMTTV